MVVVVVVVVCTGKWVKKHRTEVGCGGGSLDGKVCRKPGQ
jgi:hypothetical protein